MLITKFNKLVHDKIFWGIFAGLVCASFVVLYIPGLNEPVMAEQVAGKLYGKEVSLNDFSKARSDTYLTVWLNSGGQFRMTDAMRPLIERQTWIRLAILEKADKLGLRASDQEMLQAVRALPFFLDEQGKFNIQKYNAIVDGDIRREFGYTKRQFEEVFRDEATMQKLAYFPMQTAIVTPDQVKNAFHNLNDTFVVSYAELTEDLVKKDVKVSEADAKKFYEENKDRFATEDKVRVKYAQFPVNAYLDQVTVNDAEAQSFYDQNLTSYITKAATTNTPAEYKSFESVKGEIIDQVKVINARRKAMEVATEMVIELTPARDGTKTPTFEEAAKAMNAAVKNAPDFAASELVPGVDAGREFVTASFRLEDTKENYYSDAIVGVDNVYVIALVKKLDSFVPEFDVVKNDAIEQATEDAVRDALLKKAEELSKSAESGDFKKVLSSVGVKTKTTPEFGLQKPLEENQYANLLLDAALNLKTGEVSNPIPASADVLIIAEMTERKAADEVNIDSIREMLVSAVENQELPAIMTSWQNSVLVEADFVDMSPEAE